MTAKQLARARAKAAARAERHQPRFERIVRKQIRSDMKLASRRFREYATVHITAAGEPPGWTPPSEDELLSLDELMRRYRTSTNAVRRAAVEDYYTAFGREAADTGIRANWDVTNPVIAAELERTALHIQDISATTRTNVRGIIARAYREGLSVPDTASAIAENADEIGLARATLIARTEFAGLVNGGSLYATQIVEEHTGMAYLKVWRTAPGAEYPRHEDYDGLDGQAVPTDALFQVGTAQLAYPGDPNGPPGEVCNCRCVLQYHEQKADTEEAGGAPLEDEAASLPTRGTLDLSTGDELNPGGHVNEVWLVPDETGEQFLVKPELTAGQEAPRMRENVTPGQDIEREVAAYRMARWFNKLGGPEFQIETPATAEGTVTRPVVREATETDSGAYAPVGIDETIDREAFQGNEFDTWLSGLTPQQRGAVESYKGSKRPRAAKALASAIEQHEGLHGNYLAYLHLPAEEELEVGQSMTLPTFRTAKLGYEADLIEADPLIIPLELPRGAKVGFNPATREIILPKDAVIFRVQDYYAEAPRYRLARPPLSKSTETARAGIQDFVDDATAFVETGLDAPPVTDAEIDAAALYDVVIGNTDRHAGNYMIGDADERLILIDHGLAFPEENMGEPWNMNLVRERYRRHALEGAREGVESELFGEDDTLTDSEASVLKKLQANQFEIEQDLRKAGIPEISIEALWERIAYMLDRRVLRFAGGEEFGGG